MIELLVQLACAWFFQHILINGVLVSLMVFPIEICIICVILLLYPYLLVLMRVIKFIGNPIDDDGFNVLSVLSVLILFGSNCYDMLTPYYWNGMIFCLQQYLSASVVGVIYVVCVVKYLLLKFEII